MTVSSHNAFIVSKDSERPVIWCGQMDHSIYMRMSNKHSSLSTVQG